ncbi:MAG: endonuclease/exonuclease/phosphatase family protein [Rhizobiaceae bacterium]|nr:endonuclease/exonuclease/phosphatase family protein [Rhizobiaceae bacterium]MCV0404989.1 endonuclease/exonuclease/phosphatase family protein [Rhizobiaceae bacterium]
MLFLTAILTLLVLLATILPFLPVAHGLVRVGDFPRQQLLGLSLFLLAGSLFLSDGGGIWIVLQIVLAATAILQAAMIAEFTPLWRKQSVTYDPVADWNGEALRLVASNVKMSNNRHADLARTIAARDPDIVILMEVDDEWRRGLDGLLSRYPFIVDRCQDNSYGMLLASRLELIDVSVECLLTEGVPSIIATVKTPKGRRFRLYCIHPEPPVPHDTSAGRDGETSLVALRTREEKLPVIVTGDLNDVAWSKTTRRFRRISGLLDPRIGRKIFSTFDARWPLLRWPLDHLFHSGEFRYVRMERLDPCGSDHFPVMFELVLCSTEKAHDEPEEADGEEIGRAGDLVDDAARRDDEPIGSDWEEK